MFRTAHLLHRLLHRLPRLYVLLLLLLLLLLRLLLLLLMVVVVVVAAAVVVVVVVMEMWACVYPTMHPSSRCSVTT
jgi:hypothetical protein